MTEIHLNFHWALNKSKAKKKDFTYVFIIVDSLLGKPATHFLSTGLMFSYFTHFRFSTHVSQQWIVNTKTHL